MERSTEYVAPVKLLHADQNAQQTSSSASAAPQTPTDSWRPQTSPTSQGDSSGMQSQASFCSAEHCYPVTKAWDHSVSPRSILPGMTDLYPRQPPKAVVRDALGSWSQKRCDQFDLHQFGPNAPIGQACTTDRSDPIIDLRSTQPFRDLGPSHSDAASKRRFDSTISAPTSAALPNLAPTSCDDVLATLSDAPCFSDYAPLSNIPSLTSSGPILLNVSPRLMPQSRLNQVRDQSRGCVSPSPLLRKQSAPDSVDGFRNTTKWSTGSPTSGRSPRPGDDSGSETAMPSQRYSLCTKVSSAMASEPLHNMGNKNGGMMPMEPLYAFPVPTEGYQDSTMLMPVHMVAQSASNHGLYRDNSHQNQSYPQSLASHELLKLLQNNIERQPFHGDYADLPAPSDLYPGLQEGSTLPPQEDMFPWEPDLVPYEQDVRFDGDMYTPKWVRGHGKKREGWCGICKPGRWLVLKNSTYWYDKLFTHGISTATGAPFQDPVAERRVDGNSDAYEGLCGSCSKWVALGNRKAKRTKWFRHAYMCQSDAKFKGTFKRRREKARNAHLPNPNLS